MPELELLERAGLIWDDLTTVGEIPEPPAPWTEEPANPAEVMSPIPFYLTAEQLARSHAIA